MIIAVILCPPDLVLLVRSGPVIRDLGGSVRIWGDNGPVLISYFYDGAVPVKVFQNRSQSDFYMDMVIYRTGNICCRVTRNAGGCGVTRDQASATNFR